MADILVNTSTTRPVIEISKSGDATNIISLTCMDKINIKSSKGVHSFAVFCTMDMMKLTTAADNSVETNLIMQRESFFGTTGAGIVQDGILNTSKNGQLVDFKVYMQGKSVAATDLVVSGSGYLTGIDMSVTPDAPKWVSPLTIAVTGDLTYSTTG